MRCPECKCDESHRNFTIEFERYEFYNCTNCGFLFCPELILRRHRRIFTHSLFGVLFYISAAWAFFSAGPQFGLTFISISILIASVFWMWQEACKQERADRERERRKKEESANSPPMVAVLEFLMDYASNRFERTEDGDRWASEMAKEGWELHLITPLPVMEIQQIGFHKSREEPGFNYLYTLRYRREMIPEAIPVE